VIYLERDTRRYIGVSTDRKPTELEDGKQLPPGSSFLENDTRKIFRWDGFEWQHCEEEDESLYTLKLILFELTRLRELVTLATA